MQPRHAKYPMLKMNINCIETGHLTYLFLC